MPLEPANLPTPDRPRGDFADARFMTLNSKMVSVEAAALVDDVLGRIEAWERSSGSRRNARGKATRDKFRLAVGRVVGDLVLAANLDEDRWSFRTLDRGTFTEEAVSYRNFRSIFDALKGSRLIEVVPGYNKRTQGPNDFGLGGKATRLRASDELLRLIRSHGIEVREGKKHFQQGLPTKPLVLKATSKRVGRWKEGGRSMRFERTETTRRLEAEVREIDRFILEHELGGGTHRGYRRIFNCGDRADFAWKKGGRLYSQGEDSYQRLKEEQRLQMTIDGEAVAEIDVRASYLTILHARLGVPFDLSVDPYEVPGVPRAVVKQWVTMTLGHRTFHTRWPPEAVKELAKKGFDVKRDYPLKIVRPVITSRHPVLASWPECGYDCFDLMYLESEAVVSTMLRLLREHGVVCLSIHDSIIVPRSKTRVAFDILTVEYERVVGVCPKLTVDPEGVMEALSPMVSVGA